MQPRKILAIKLRALGDTVLMTAPLTELRKAYPNAELHVAVEKRWAPILENFPGIDRIWTYERHADKTARARAAARMAIRMREEGFDCVVNFHASPSSAMISRATGARVRSIHFHGHKDKNLYSTVTVPGKGVLKPAIERDMDAIRALGIDVPEGQLPVIHLKQSEVFQAVARMQRDLTLPEPVMGMSLAASRPSKSWPIERFAELAIAWCRKEKGSVFAIAGPDEGAILQKFVSHVDAVLEQVIENPQERRAIRTRIQIENSLNIRQLAALLSRFAVFVGNDSGPKHMAIAVNTPTVTLFGPEDPYEWHPYNREQHPYFFINEMECRKDAEPGMRPWCGVAECTDSAHKCMTKISVDSVLAESQRVAKR